MKKIYVLMIGLLACLPMVAEVLPPSNLAWDENGKLTWTLPDDPNRVGVYYALYNAAYPSESVTWISASATGSSTNGFYDFSSRMVAGCSYYVEIYCRGNSENSETVTSPTFVKAGEFSVKDISSTIKFENSKFQWEHQLTCGGDAPNHYVVYKKDEHGDWVELTSGALWYWGKEVDMTAYLAPNTEFKIVVEIYQLDLKVAEGTKEIMTPDLYTVTFHANGHGSDPAAQEVYEGDKAKTVSMIDGMWLLDKWTTDVAGENEWNFNTPITEDLELYGQWILLELTNAHWEGKVACWEKNFTSTGYYVDIFNDLDESVMWSSGSGNGTSYDCSNVLLPGYSYYFKVKLKLEDGVTYTEFITSEMMSVPGEREIKDLAPVIEGSGRVTWTKHPASYNNYKVEVYDRDTEHNRWNTTPVHTGESGFWTYNWYDGYQTELLSSTLYKVVVKAYQESYMIGIGAVANGTVNQNVSVSGEHGTFTAKDKDDNVVDLSSPVAWGTKLTITATPDAHYDFVEWSNGATDATITIDLDTDTALVATFAPHAYTITIVSDHGTVTAKDGDDNVVDLSDPVVYGTVLTLTATADTDYKFDGWTNYDPATGLAVDADVTITANYHRIGAGLDAVKADAERNNEVRKIYREGRILIVLPDGRVLNTLGVEVK